MTAVEAFELITEGGTTDFARLIKSCEACGPHCLIGGFAVNCYLEPVYSLDVDLVVNASIFSTLSADLREQRMPTSQLRIQLTTDERYQSFLNRSVGAEVLGIRMKVACLEDVTQGKLWAYADPSRRFSERKKDELDLIRLAESYPDLRALFPEGVNELIDRETSA